MWKSIQCFQHVHRNINLVTHVVQMHHKIKNKKKYTLKHINLYKHKLFTYVYCIFSFWTRVGVVSKCWTRTTLIYFFFNYQDISKTKTLMPFVDSFNWRNKWKTQKCPYENSTTNDENVEVSTISGGLSLRYNSTRTFDLSSTKFCKLVRAVIK